MLLAVDLGNTKLTYAVFNNEVILSRNSVSYPKNADLQSIKSIFEGVMSEYRINRCAVSSVVDELNPVLAASLADLTGFMPLFLNSNMNLGIKFKTKNYSNIGMDRIANACAGIALYKKTPLIVVDSGSAATFDIIDKEGVFVGGVIFAGLYMHLNALGMNTSKLPKLDLSMMKNVHNVINIETPNAILSGVVNGYIKAVSGLIKECEKELGEKPFIIGTGGDAQFLKELMPEGSFDAISPNLTLEGIRIIYEQNT